MVRANRGQSNPSAFTTKPTEFSGFFAFNDFCISYFPAFITTKHNFFRYLYSNVTRIPSSIASSLILNLLLLSSTAFSLKGIS